VLKTELRILLNYLKRQLDTGLPAKNGAQDFVLHNQLLQCTLYSLDIDFAVEFDNALRKLRSAALMLQPRRLLLR
jgi:hypothetical protein